MDKYYKTIASLRLQHNFYASKSLPAASIKPLPETELFFRNHRMLFKRKNDGYVILQEAELESKTPTIRFEPSPRYLAFGIHLNDNHYQLRSGLNFDPRKEKIVVQTGAEDEYLVSETNILPLWSNLNTGGEEPVVITDRNKETVFSSETDDKIQFNNLDTGVYTANAVPFLKCEHASGFEAILILELTETEEPVTRTIVLPAGRYRWRYQVQKKYSQPAALSLVDENEKVLFNTGDPTKEDLSVFLSTEAVPLSELIFTSLVLYNNDTIVKRFLPVPGLEHARFLSAEEKSLVLEAYVTV